MNREQYLAYMKEYNKKTKYHSKPMSSSNLIDGIDDIYNYTHLVVHPTKMNFNGSDKDEPRYCKTFGCGKQLSLEENRFGDKCVHCANKNKTEIDIAMRISHPIKKTA